MALRNDQPCQPDMPGELEIGQGEKVQENPSSPWNSGPLIAAL